MKDRISFCHVRSTIEEQMLKDKIFLKKKQKETKRNKKKQKETKRNEKVIMLIFSKILSGEGGGAGDGDAGGGGGTTSS